MSSTRQHKNYDIIILGAGIGGIVSALLAKRKGLKIALIEKENVGGLCLNWGGISVKELSEISNNYASYKESLNQGLFLSKDKNLKIDWKKIKAAAKKRSEGYNKYVRELLNDKNIDILKGKYRVVDSQTIQYKQDILKTQNLILAIGSGYQYPKFAENKKDIFFTPLNFLELDELPREISIVGGGIVGIEYALLLAGFDVKVKLFEENNELMNYLDEDLSKSLRNELEKNKISLYEGHKIVDYEDNSLIIQYSDKVKEIKSKTVLWATRRLPNVEGLKSLVEKGLELKNGFIRTDLRGCGHHTTWLYRLHRMVAAP